MSRFESSNEFKDFIGRDIEEVYAKLFGAGKPVGGLRDGGKDIPTGLKDMPFVQTKGSIQEAYKFSEKSKEFGRFIPICVGEPGTKEEVVESLRSYGAWFEKDIPHRQELLQEYRKRRAEIYDTSRNAANTGKANNRTRWN